MNQDQINRLLTQIAMWLGLSLGIITLIAFLVATIKGSADTLGVALLGSVFTGGLGIGAWFLARSNRDDNRGIGSVAEQQLLTPKQKRELRKARGAVIMEKALIDVEHERQNIVHNQIEAANDPDKPPHVTSFSEEFGSMGHPRLERPDPSRRGDRA